MSNAANFGMGGFWSGFLMAQSLIIGLFFLKFWRKSGERLFLYFSIAFGLMGIERLALYFTSIDNEAQVLVYSFRLFAFALITYAIVDKNRRTAAR